ncbi:MAG: hypothetical protein J3K34DRAFT_429005 [Monoraphidium minutum]|nr:MAG: hypothetical protein J3K34DRAFT_429005 [Monoraphidium minutum]
MKYGEGRAARGPGLPARRRSVGWRRIRAHSSSVVSLVASAPARAGARAGEPVRNRCERGGPIWSRRVCMEAGAFGGMGTKAHRRALLAARSARGAAVKYSTPQNAALQPRRKGARRCAGAAIGHIQSQPPGHERLERRWMGRKGGVAREERAGRASSSSPPVRCVMPKKGHQLGSSRAPWRQPAGERQGASTPTTPVGILNRRRCVRTGATARAARPPLARSRTGSPHARGRGCAPIHGRAEACAPRRDRGAIIGAHATPKSDSDGFVVVKGKGKGGERAAASIRHGGSRAPLGAA